MHSRAQTGAYAQFPRSKHSDSLRPELRKAVRSSGPNHEFYVAPLQAGVLVDILSQQTSLVMQKVENGAVEHNTL